VFENAEINTIKNIAVLTVLYFFTTWFNITVWKCWLPASKQVLYLRKFLFWNTYNFSSKTLVEFLQRKLNLVYFHFFSLFPEWMCQKLFNIKDGICFFEVRGAYNFVRAQCTADFRYEEKWRSFTNFKAIFGHQYLFFWPLCILRRGEGASRHNVYFLVFHVFSVLTNLNIRAQLGSVTHGLQSELYNFHDVSK